MPAFPPGVETVTVTAGALGYRAPDGSYATGTIRFTPSVSRVTSATHGVITLGTVNATLGASGDFTATLLAIDADDFSPSGWTYRVDEELTGAPGRAYNISLPAAVPAVTLPALSPVASTSGTVSAPAVLSVNGETGVVTLSPADVGADPTGTAAAAVATHSADTTAVHGITDTAALETAAGATAKVTTHTGATDPHGDRAWADGKFATIIVVTDLSGDVTQLDTFVQDCLTRVAGIEQGTAFLSGLNVAGNAQVANGNLTVTDFTRGYRFRLGSALDLEGTGGDLIVSNWSGNGFNGTQHSYFRLSADAQNIQVAGKVEYTDSLYGTVRHVLDGAANTLGFHGATPTARQTVTGSRGGNAALASLLTALANLGLITDSTTA